MASSLFSYSALKTKTSAMLARHLSTEQYDELCQKTSVGEACSFLKNNTVYAPLFEGVGEKSLHRSDIEAMLDDYVGEEIKKIYHFCDRDAKAFLGYTVVHYEINLIKSIVKYILSNALIPLHQEKTDFYSKRICFDAVAAAEAHSLRELLAVLNGTPYYNLLNPLFSTNSTDLFTIETQLDIYYFKYVWQLKDKTLHGKDREIVSQSFGNEIDMQNLMWIYRQKKYFDTSNEIIATSIIPIHYRLKMQTLNELIATPDINSFLALAKQTKYKSLFDDLDNHSIEENYADAVHRHTASLLRKNSFSIAAAIYYLHNLEIEIKRIISAIERIRYGINRKEA